MPAIENLRSLQTKLKALARRHGVKKASVTVGYTQSYSLAVHENMAAHHSNGQAKYLEQPARQLTNDKTLSKLTETTVKSGGTLVQGLVIAGLRLQRESQLLVPVDTGALKASAFTAKEADVGSAAAAAFSKSEAIRKKAEKK